MPKAANVPTTYKLLIFVLLASPLNLFANFDFNANCLKAYRQIFELKIAVARQTIATEKRIHPDNAIVPLLENYADYFYLLATDSKSEFERLEQNKDRRLDLISDDDKNSPYCLYAQAEINLQWALLRARYGSYLTSARELNRANNQLVENNKKFPSFHLNLKGLGLVNSVMGALPDGFLKSTLSTLGLKGNLQTGLAQLEKLAENLPKSSYEPFYEEAVFYYAYVLTDVARSTNAYPKIMKYTARFADSSLLKTYLQAYSCNKSGHNDEAIEILASRPTGAIYQSFPYLDYLMGIMKLNKLDFNAETYFNRFLQTNKGVDYVKDTYLHLAWIDLLKGDDAGFASANAKVKSAGYVYLERDKQALNEANAPKPNKDLLKARLLFDGGYFSKALAILADHQTDDFASAKDKSEFYYRLGRVNDNLGKDDTAMDNYQNAYNIGKGLRYYYAAKSMVQLGKIYDKKRNVSKAKSCFNAAINLSGHEFESSIENEAKAGIRKLGN